MVQVGAKLLLRIQTGRSPFLTEQVRLRVNLFSAQPTDYRIPGAEVMLKENMVNASAPAEY